MFLIELQTASDHALCRRVGVVGHGQRALVATGRLVGLLGRGRVELAALTAGAGLEAVHRRGHPAVAGVRVPLKICLVIRSRSMAREMALRRSGVVLELRIVRRRSQIHADDAATPAGTVPVREVGLVRVADELVRRDVAVVDVVEAAGHRVGVGRRRSW